MKRKKDYKIEITLMSGKVIVKTFLTYTGSAQTYDNLRTMKKYKGEEIELLRFLKAGDEIEKISLFKYNYNKPKKRRKKR